MQGLVRDFDADRSKLHLQTAEYVRARAKFCAVLRRSRGRVRACMHFCGFTCLASSAHAPAAT